MSRGLISRLRALLNRRRPVPELPAAVQPALPATEIEAAAPVGWRAFLIASAQGGLAVTPPGGGVLGVASEAGSAVVAIVPETPPYTCFLMAHDASPVAVAPDERRAVAVSARILPTDTAGVVRLKYPVAGARFLEAQPALAASGLDLRFDGEGNSLRAIFNMQPMERAAVPEAVADVAGEAAEAARHLHAHSLLALLRNGRVRPALAEPLIRLLPEDELAELARLVTAAPADLALLGRAMPGDRWVTERLPALAAWQAGRGGAGARRPPPPPPAPPRARGGPARQVAAWWCSARSTPTSSSASRPCPPRARR